MPKESAYFIVRNDSDSDRFDNIRHTLDSMHGVTSVKMNSDHSLVAVEYDSAGTSYDAIENRLNRMGFEIAADASQIHTR